MTAPLRRSRPYVFWGQTTSLCETCLALVPAKIEIDRKSTRLNSSHGSTSYAVFCLQKRMRRSSALLLGAPPCARVLRAPHCRERLQRCRLARRARWLRDLDGGGERRAQRGVRDRRG